MFVFDNPSGGMGQSAVLTSYRDGVRSVEGLAAIVDWDARIPCRDWRPVDLVGHLLTIVRYYHRLLDAAANGQPLSGLPQGSQLAAMNARELATLTEVGGARRAREFVAAADDYAERLHSADWAMTLGVWSGMGPLTLGQHTVLILGEWHVHAWDLPRTAGLDYEPDDPVIVAKGQGAVVIESGSDDPWTWVLAAYGRDHNWAGTIEGSD